MSHLFPTILLASITFVWGWSFVLVKDAIAAYGVMSFLAVRFIIAALVMGPYSARRLTWNSVAVGIPVGLVLSASFLAQTFGLQYTTATNSGLITGLFVVFAPVANRVMFGVHTRWLSWAAIGISFIGLALLTGSGPTKLNIGDLLTLIGAAFIGVFIALLDRYARQHDAVAFAFVQVIVSTVGFLVLWPMIEPMAWPTGDVWFALLVTGVISTAAGASIQNYAQQRLPAVRVTVIIALTPLFAALFGYLAAGDRLTGIQVVGAVLMVSAVIVAEVLGNNQKEPT